MDGHIESCVEESVEINYPNRQYGEFGDANEIEHLPQGGAGEIEVHPILVPDHAVAETICCDRELDRHPKRASDRRTNRRHRLVNRCLATDSIEIIVNDTPLIMVGDDLFGFD